MFLLHLTSLQESEIFVFGRMLAVNSRRSRVCSIVMDWSEKSHRGFMQQCEGWCCLACPFKLVHCAKRVQMVAWFKISSCYELGRVRNGKEGGKIFQEGVKPSNTKIIFLLLFKWSKDGQISAVNCSWWGLDGNIRWRLVSRGKSWIWWPLLETAYYRTLMSWLQAHNVCADTATVSQSSRCCTSVWVSAFCNVLWHGLFPTDIEASWWGTSNSKIHSVWTSFCWNLWLIFSKICGEHPVPLFHSLAVDSLQSRLTNICCLLCSLLANGMYGHI